MSSESREREHSHWLERPALIWERRNPQETTNGYWNESLLFQEWIQGDDDDELSTLSYRSMLAISALLMEGIVLEVNECLKDDDIRVVDGSSAVPSIPIAVAVPEGIFLPIAIAAVHALNEPSSSMNHHFSAILLPIEPTEGAQRLRHMLSEARPLLVLTASDCDQERLRELLDRADDVQRRETDEDYTNSVDPSSGLYRSSMTLVVDLRELLAQAKLRHGSLLDKNADFFENAIAGGSGLPSIRLLEQLRLSLISEDDSNTGDTISRPPNRISHIVYTSGTTGAPKGCISSSQSLRHYLGAKNTAHDISESSVVLLASALSFDPCLSDVLATFFARATLALSPRDSLYSQLDRTLHTLRITHVLCTPTLWSTLAVTGIGPNDLPCLKVVALGGEPIPQQIRQTWARPTDDNDNGNNRGCRLLATFGVTEACVYQTAGEVFRQNCQSTSHGHDVGAPFPGLGVRICLEDNQDELVDVPGERDIGEVILFGQQLDQFSSYLNRPELSSVKFVYDKAKNEYHYRTGDRGCVVDSHLYILGRIQGEDGMVKYNGIRVELGEVEAAILDDRSAMTDASIVVDCLVSATSPPTDKVPSTSVKELIAYVILSHDCQKELGLWAASQSLLSSSSGIPSSGVLCTGPLLALLRERCKSRARVVPTAFVCLPRIPVSPTGKRDRKGVPPLSESVPIDTLSSSIASSGNDTPSIPLTEYGSSGSIVAAEIIDCLNLQRSQCTLMTTTATFAMLGGDSLAATRVVRALYAYQYKVFNTRFLGGEYGVLDDNRFGVVHLLRAKNLGEYVDFLDKQGLCQPENGTAVNVGVSSPRVTENMAQAKMGQEEETSSLTNLRDAEASHLYDALLQATMQGHTSIAIGLLAVGADPNSGNHGKRLGKTSGRTERKTKFWSSPLHLACLKGNPRLVRELLRRGAKLNTPDASGLYPLHLAATASADESTDVVDKTHEDLQRLDCVKMLLDAGAPLTMKDGNKQTVIHVAARAGHCSLLRHVMKVWKVWMADDSTKQSRQESLDWRDRWSRTPVHWAILNGHVDALEVLLEMGCSPNPVQPKVNRSTSAAIECPIEMCSRLYESSSPMAVKIATLLEKAQGMQG